MIHGIGCDIVNIDRIHSIYSEFKDKFLKHIFTSREIEIFKLKNITNKNVDDVGLVSAYIAKRFAAKESYLKANGTGIREAIGFKNLEILNDQMGKPYINLIDMPNLNSKIHLSISDDKPYAIAYVIIER